MAVMDATKTTGAMMPVVLVRPLEALGQYAAAQSACSPGYYTLVFRFATNLEHCKIFSSTPPSPSFTHSTLLSIFLSRSVNTVRIFAAAVYVHSIYM